MADMTKISGIHTVGDWAEFKNSLEEQAQEADWGTAYEVFLYERLRTRYLEPIDLLIKADQKLGEGFTIVSIQCALIEFLAALYVGKSHKLKDRRGPPLGEHEYSKSRELFCDFLVEKEPFSKWFNRDGSKEFYKKIRCGLLHEAQTKDGWRILADGHAPIDFEEKIVFRNQLQKAIKDFLAQYKLDLQHSQDLQKAFIRKLDGLAAHSPKKTPEVPSAPDPE